MSSTMHYDIVKTFHKLHAIYIKALNNIKYFCDLFKLDNVPNQVDDTQDGGKPHNAHR